MGIYIKGMEIPRGCAFCKIARRNGKKMVCPFSGEEWDIYDPMSSDFRLVSCPLVPVPPHGRLIDADALFEEVYKVWGTEYDASECNTLMGFINEAPTIIPAEPSEEQREYEAQVEAAQYCEMYEPTCDPETGAL